MALILACARPKPPLISPKENPSYHYLQGMRLIEQNKIIEAENHFDHALYLNKDYSPAFSGKALVLVIRGNTKKSLVYLKKAKRKARNNTQKFIYHLTAIRVYTRGGFNGWLDKAERHYKDAISLKGLRELPYYQTYFAAHYFMGVAYYKGYKFKKAKEILIKINSGKWYDKANSLYKKIQRIVRVCDQYLLSDLDKKILVKDQITRADLAVLLVDELHLNRLLSSKLLDFTPVDALGHPFEEEIVTVARWNIKGLQAKYDPNLQAYLFRPQSFIKRKELAIILEGLLMRLKLNKNKDYFNIEESPFPDVPIDTSWFNAVMDVIAKGLMRIDPSGAFRPEDNVDGIEAILALMKLKDMINK